ncbi:WD40 repeat-like protein [Macrolepiota fuliginosa MF-IS2]|uniref:Protein HIR n=1 Tax=Macrolepiota fuliginosa MF-IS2 TaxID=1400762 RepID=A0A9P6C6D1_9AGAR|nr:WD40 repeat-like protein [Macrolepiota fuliginosa MF-IS2]
MHFTKPAWVIHKDSAKTDANPKRLSIFSVHVHPDGSRIATGGLDAKVRIWSTKPILNPASEESGRPPKSLCTLSMHTGPVLTVRWAHSGRWLASGSDDEIVMIWDLDPNARGKVWGSDEVNVEGWKPLKRLPGHESDVTDVAWSPGDRHLASVGLDSAVIIWCGFTLERLHKIDQHQGFVKGVCWDPVGEFLATQSDDRSVKIWRTTDWGLEAEVRKPFEDSPGSTFFRRLSWSPDGAHITASNATNNKGFVFIAAVITRNTWTSEISLVGHENTIEVASYNPHIFLRNPNAPVATANICSVVALGADDRSVSIWQTKSARPLIVAKEVFDRQIMDLSWSWDGLTLYAASSDGTIGVFNFEPEELEGIAPHSVQEQYLAKFGFKAPSIPEGYSHLSTPMQMQDSHHTPQNDFDNNGGEEKINVLVAKKSNKNKKRINLSSVPSAAIPSASTNGLGPSTSMTSNVSIIPVHDFSKRAPSSRIVASSAFPSPPEQPFDSSHARGDWSMDMDANMDSVSISALDGPTSQAQTQKGKSRSGSDEGKGTFARNLGGNVHRGVGVVKEIAGGVGGGGTDGLWRDQQDFGLSVPPIMTYLNCEVEGAANDILEVWNYESGAHTRIMFASNKEVQWLDYVPSPVLLAKATNVFCVVAMQDGSVNVYSPNGRRLLPTLNLGSPASHMDANKHCLMIVTLNGLLYSWNIKKQSANFPPVSLRPILSNPNTRLTGVSTRSSGVSMLSCSNAVVYTYDLSLNCFTKLADRWWNEGSDAWQKQRSAVTAGGNSSKGLVAYVEGYCNNTPVAESPTATTSGGAGEKAKPQWWAEALTLGHLETRMYAAKMLDSPVEYKQALFAYARRLADEGFRWKAEELIRELFGPVYWRPGRDDGWTPTVAGMAKRDLLKEVLSVFARSKTLTKLGVDWQDTLKKAASDD